MSETDPDDGEAALLREAAAAARAEAERYGEIERTPSANDAFAAKMKAWREGRSILRYEYLGELDGAPVLRRHNDGKVTGLVRFDDDERATFRRDQRTQEDGR